MRHLLVASCLSLAALLSHTGPAAACLNDRDTARVERDFKSNYEFKSGYQIHDSVPASAEQPWAPVAVTGSGALLMLAAVGFVTFNIRRSR